MNRFAKTLVLALSTLSFMPLADAQTPGSVAFNTSLVSVNGKWGTKHYVVAWVTKEDGTFVKTLWKQGKTFTSSEWTTNCPSWNTARGGSNGSTAFDGYTSATAPDYTAAANNPIDPVWNCLDGNNTLVPDGNYKFWVQYGHSDAAGPVTTNGLLWTKRSTSFSTTFTNTSSFTNMSITWTPTAAPEIAVEQPVGTNLTDGSATANYGSVNLGSSSAPLTFTVKNTGNAALTGVSINKDGTHAADFAVSSIATSVAAGGSTTFTVIFTPGAAGVRTAAIHLVSNDANENPFDITLTGTGGAVPEIAIEQPAGTGLTDGTAALNYGVVDVGQASAAMAFTIRNVGSANLTGLSVTKDGVNSTDFAVGTLGSTTLAPGASTTFSVTFTPGAIGSRTAAIHVASNDLDEASFDINLSGTGEIRVYTGGIVSLSATLGSYGGAEHWSVAWVTKADGTFIKTLDIRGNFYDGDLAAFWDTHWNDHCPTWVAARGASQGLDGFTGATAANYNPPNSPLNVTWNGRDANNTLMPDGTYKLWVQYSEDDEAAPGPVTTSGLTWTKGATATSSSPANQGSSFTAMSINWTPTPPPAPEIAVEQPLATNLTDGGAKDFGTVILGSSASLTFTVKNTGNADLTGLTITQDGTHSADFSISALPVAPVSGPSGFTTFIVQFTPSGAGARSAAIHLASNDGDENPFDLTLTGTGISAFDSWAAGAGLGAGADPMATPKGDGVSNLEKFAFNLDASKADVRRLVVGGGGLSGLPGTTLIAGPTLRLEYLRRKASSNPGITYVAQFGSDLTGWTPATGTPTSIDDTWERVVVDDAPPVGSTKRFGRVVVSQP